jgi:hypothetical protein
MNRHFLFFSLLLSLILSPFSCEAALPTSAQIWSTICRYLTFDSAGAKSLSKYEWNRESENEIDPLSLGWVQRLLEEFPELSWFAHEDVRRTFDAGYENEPSFSWSKKIFNVHHPEFDRAVLSIWCLRSFYNGSRESWQYFVQSQPEEIQFHWESFSQIHQELIRFLESHPWMSKDQALLTMETYLIIADACKTPHAQKKAREYRVYVSDTKDFFQKTVDVCPQIYPSLKRLSYPCLELIKRTANPLHMGHLRHLEGHPGMLRRLIESKLLHQHPADFEFFYLVDLCDTAAFFGQASIRGSLFLDESMYQINVSVKQAALNTLQMDEFEAYRLHLEERAKSLGFGIETKEDRTLTRIGAMLRLHSPQDGKMLKRAFQKLDLYNQALLLSQLDIRTFDPLKRSPHYIPAVLNNMLNNPKLGQNFQERLDKVFILALPFIAQVMQEHRKELTLRQADRSLPLNFNLVAKKVASNPYLLNHVIFKINENNVVIVE